MANIKVKLEAFATEADVNEVLKKVKDNVPPEHANNATVIRDANGKAIGVDVGLPPAVTENDRSNAVAAIAANPGAASVSAYPIEESYDFNALTPGEAVTSFGTKMLWSRNTYPYNVGTLKAAEASETISGSGSALICAGPGMTMPSGGYPPTALVQRTSSGLVTTAQSMDLSKYIGYDLQFDLRISTAGADGATSESKVVTILSAGYPMVASYLRTGSMGENWILKVSGDYVDTELVNTQPIRIKAKYDLNGIWSIAAHNVSTDALLAQDSHDVGYVKPLYDLRIATGVVSTYPYPGSLVQKGFIIDNLIAKILGGEEQL